MIGAESKGDSLLITLTSDKPWKGKLFLDHNRFKDNMNLPLDWPRINQFPQWFSAESTREYTLTDLTSKEKSNKTGEQLNAGVSLELTGEKRLVIF